MQERCLSQSRYEIFQNLYFWSYNIPTYSSKFQLAFKQIFHNAVHKRYNRFVLKLVVTIIWNELVTSVRFMPQSLCPSFSCTACSKISEFPGDTSQVFILHNWSKHLILAVVFYSYLTRTFFFKKTLHTLDEKVHQ